MSFPSLVAYGGDDSDEDRNDDMDTDDRDRGQNDQEESAIDVGRNARKESELWDDDPFVNEDNSDDDRHSNKSGTASPSEPPPPPGHNNRRNTPPSILKTTGFQKAESMVSLVGYSGEEDSFAKFDAHQESAVKTSDESENSGSSDRSAMEIRQASPKIGSEEQVTKEPRPPERQSYDDEDAIDQIIREGQEAISETHLFTDDHSPGSSSPMPGPIEDKDYVEGPEKEDGPCELPSDAEDEADPKVMDIFARCFDMKANGYDFNGRLQSDRKFTNPSGYVIIKEKFNIDEKGTNFPKSLFDPNMFPEDCYYDKLADVQNKMMEAWQKRQK